MVNHFGWIQGMLEINFDTSVDLHAIVFHLHGAVFLALIVAERLVDKEVVLGIRPEDIHDEQLFIESSPESVIDARINIYEMLGAEVYLYFTIDQFDITARVNARTTARPGDTVQFAFDLSKIHIFDKETEEILVS